jgi:hypothetical protein
MVSVGYILVSGGVLLKRPIEKHWSVSLGATGACRASHRQ